MTVAELIEILKTHPQDMEVCVNGYEGGYTSVKAGSIKITPMLRNVNNEWCYGEHDDIHAGDKPDMTALLLSR